MKMVAVFDPLPSDRSRNAQPLGGNVGRQAVKPADVTRTCGGKRRQDPLHSMLSAL